jgi:hypothetical protein
MREEMDRVILNLIQFGILDKLFKDYDFTIPNEGKFFFYNTKQFSKCQQNKFMSTSLAYLP